MSDVTIVGGGIIGLSIARELARAGMRVRVLERGGLGREASWAGAGMLPPGNLELADSPEARLRGLSARLWPTYAGELAEEAGVDVGYRQTGSILLYGEDRARDQELGRWRSEGIVAMPIDAREICELEQHLSIGNACGIHLPTQAQIRNPRYVKALVASCAEQGVELVEQIGNLEWIDPGDVSQGLRAGMRQFQSDRYCIAAGSWSPALLTPLGCSLPIEPVRGQIVLLNDPRRILSRIVEQGFRYIVPRGDGRLLVGSTMERAGFEKRVTAKGVGDLLRFATRLCPALETADIERTWAGLRPGSPDGLPFLGSVPGSEKVFVAAGHFRSGIQMSPGTARLVCQAILGQRTDIDLAEFGPSR